MSSRALEAPAAVLVDKPVGPTSHDVVQDIRREYGAKAGHAGTLDPFASGLLVILLGRATRLQRYLLGLSKVYEATARLGWVSSTGDPTGELENTGQKPSELALPTGVIRQKLPMTSAVRVDGERLYEKAHRGEQIETPVRETVIHSADLLRSDDSSASYRIDCASGTYVRSLIETLEDAYCSELRRISIGPFEVPEGGPVELSAGQLLAFMPERNADETEAERVGHGGFIPAGRVRPTEAAVGSLRDRVRITNEGRVVAVARLGEAGQLEPEVVLV